MEPLRVAGRLPRRRMLAGTGALAGAALAGCIGGTGPDSGRSADGGAGGQATDGDGTAIETHPAGAGLADQPTLGPDPLEAEAAIVAFEDPSCTRCRVFEAETVPRIQAELVEPGRAAYVFRGYPVVYPWGEPATQALESTFARDAAAFWALKDHYYAEQSAFDEGNVLARTREFLAGETALNADAVVADAEARVHDPAVRADLDAGMAAGAGRTTPHVFLFRDGEYVTKAAGSVSFSVLTNALGL